MDGVRLVPLGVGGGGMEEDGAGIDDDEAGPEGGGLPRSALGPVGTPW